MAAAALAASGAAAKLAPTPTPGGVSSLKGPAAAPSRTAGILKSPRAAGGARERGLGTPRSAKPTECSGGVGKSIGKGGSTGAATPRAASLGSKQGKKACAS